MKTLNRNVILNNYNLVARVVASFYLLHSGGVSGGDGLHEHDTVVSNIY